MEALFEMDAAGVHHASALTRGPWSADHQHFGPPAAILGRAIARTDGGDGKRVARITFEVLRPVPIAGLSVMTRVVRPGARIDLVDAVLTGADDGVEYALARAWRMRVADIEVRDTTAFLANPLPGPEQAESKTFFLPGDVPGYHRATDWRFVQGGFMELGPATAWCRLQVPLIAGEEPTPLERVLVAVDSGNGISAVATPAELLFVNTDLTVHLHRDPVGEWVALSASTHLEPTGTGLATSVIHDEQGPIGRGLQTLFVDVAR